MEIHKVKIKVGNTALEDHGVLELQQLKGNTFYYQLPINSSNPLSSDSEQLGKLSGKTIFMWVTADDGQKNFLIGTVAEIKSAYTYGNTDVLLSGEVKKMFYPLSILTNYWITLSLSLIIPIVFISIFGYLLIDQKQHLVQYDGTITSFTKRSGGARSPAVLTFKSQEFQASFQRRYEGLSRLLTTNLSHDIHIKSESLFPLDSLPKLKPASQRKYSWYIDVADQDKLKSAAATLPYIYLHQTNSPKKSMFLYDVYNYIFYKYDMMTYLGISFLSTTAFLLMGAGMKHGNKLFWKIYGVLFMLTYLLMFLL